MNEQIVYIRGLDKNDTWRITGVHWVDYHNGMQSEWYATISLVSNIHTAETSVPVRDLRPVVVQEDKIDWQMRAMKAEAWAVEWQRRCEQAEQQLDAALKREIERTAGSPTRSR